MSKRNNVNPDHYVGRGRDGNATGIVHDIQKQQFGTTRTPRRGQGAPNFIPGAAPVGEPGGKAPARTPDTEKEDK